MPNAMFFMIEAELTLDQNMKVVDLIVSFPMHQESPHLDLYRLRKDQNNPN